MPAAKKTRRFWLLKTEPGTFSFDDLMRAPKKTTGWDGVRNYQARNLLRDEMQEGDGVFIYHSSTDVPAVVGVAVVARAGYPDPNAFDRKSPYHDPKSDPDKPKWFQIDVRGVEALPRPVSLAQLRETPALEGMNLLRKGNRLSVQPVTGAEWRKVRALGGLKGD